MDKRYKAWIPNVTGRLSFSHIGPLHNHKRNLSKNLTHSEGVDLVCIDTRNSSDTSMVLGKRLKKRIDKLLKKQGEYVFFAIGYSDPKFDELKGHVFKFTLKNWELNAKEITSSTAIGFPQNEDGVAEYRERSQEIIASLKKFCGYNGNHYASFSLTRPGELTIEFDKASYHFQTSFDDVASSMFRFFREICHTHQHHTDRNDVILDTYAEGTNTNHWSDEALYSMMRYVIMAKRSRDLESYQSALGVTAYAETFHRNFIEVENGTRTNPKYNFAELRHSLQAGLDRAKWQDQRIPSWITVASFAFAMVSLLLLVLRTSFTIRDELPISVTTAISDVEILSTEWRMLAAYTDVFFANPLATTLVIGFICFALPFIFQRFLNKKPTAWTLEFLRLYLARIRVFSIDVSFIARICVATISAMIGISAIATGFASILGEEGIQFVYPWQAFQAVFSWFSP